MREAKKGKKVFKFRYILYAMAISLFLLLFIVYYSLPFLLESALNPIFQEIAENGRMNLQVNSVGLFTTTFEFSAIPNRNTKNSYYTKVEQGMLRYTPFELLVHQHLKSVEFHKIKFPLYFKDGKMEMPVMRMLKTSASSEKKYMMNDLPFTFEKWIMDGDLLLDVDFLTQELTLPFRAEINTDKKKWPAAIFELIAQGPHSYIRTFGDWDMQTLSGLLHAQIDPHKITRKKIFTAIDGKIHAQAKYTFDLETSSLVSLSVGSTCKLNYVFSDTGTVIQCTPRITLQTEALRSDLKAEQIHLHCTGLQANISGHPVSLSFDYFWNWSKDIFSGKAFVTIDQSKKPQLELSFQMNNISQESVYSTADIASAKDISIDIVQSDVHYKTQKLFGHIQCHSGKDKKFDFKGEMKKIEISDPTMKLTADTVKITAYGTPDEAKILLDTLNFKGVFPEEKISIEMPEIVTESHYKDGMLKFTCKGSNGTFEMGSAGISAHKFSGHLPGEYKNGKFTSRGFLVSDDTSLYGYLMGKTVADVDWNNRNVDIKFRGKNTVMKGQYDTKLYYGKDGWEKPKNSFHAKPHTPRDTMKYTGQYLYDASKHIIRCDLQSLLGYDAKRSFIFPEFLVKSLDYLSMPFKYTADVIWAGIRIPGQSALNLYKKIIPAKQDAEKK